MAWHWAVIHDSSCILWGFAWTFQHTRAFPYLSHPQDFCLNWEIPNAFSFLIFLFWSLSHPGLVNTFPHRIVLVSVLVSCELPLSCNWANGRPLNWPFLSARCLVLSYIELSLSSSHSFAIIFSHSFSLPEFDLLLKRTSFYHAAFEPLLLLLHSQNTISCALTVVGLFE